MGLGPANNPLSTAAAQLAFPQGSGGKGSAGELDASSMWRYASTQMPELGNIVVDGLFFNWAELEAGDAWKVYPYQFEIHDGTFPLKTLSMPLAPQSIAINVPTATVTTVTMRGVTEEHNDAPLRQIVITGTTGVNPGGGFVSKSNGSVGSQLLEYAFANTIQAANKAKSTGQKTATAFDTAVKSLTGGATRFFDSPLVSADDIEGGNNELNLNSAYRTIHNMSRFFDYYLAAKKKGAQKLFLSFYMHKDRMYYDCTLNNYSIRKMAGSMEYQYSITLTAWRRRPKPVGEIPAPVSKTSASDDKVANIFAAVNNLLTGLTNTVNQLANIFKGFSKDFETVVLGPIKKVGLLIKTLGGLVTTIGDFPNALMNLAKNAIKSAFKQTMQTNAKSGKLEKLQKTLKDKNLNSPAPAGQPNSYGSNVIANDVSKQESSTKSDDPGEDEETPDPFEQIFSDPQEFADVFSFFTLDELEISDNLQDLINQEINNALALTADDVIAIKNDFESFIATYSEFVGGGNVSYNRINGRGTVREATKSLSVEDITTLSSLNDGLEALDTIIVMLDEKDKSQTSDFDYAQFYAEQARSYGIDFVDGVSKFYVPFEFGSTLERMSYKYLGDASRWVEIAAINALKSPYVDEEGFLIDFIASGAGNSFSVASANNLYVGQVVEISSDVQRTEVRTIRSIDTVSSVEVIITVDGNEDMAKFTVADNSKLKAFLPNTVNSNQLIAIPSTVPINVPGTIRLNPDEDDLTFITYTAKADFLLHFDKQNNADIAFTGADIKIARGMQNIQQAATIKVLIKLGDLLHDPSFGNPIEVGSSQADINAKDIISQLSILYSQDPRFNSVRAGRVSKTANAILVDLVIGLQNSQAYLPFSAAIPIGK